MSNFDFITVVGVGARRNGVSKAGNAYDFCPVYITFEPGTNESVNGKVAAEVLVDTDTVYRVRPVPGDEFTVCLNKSRSGVTISHWISRGRVDLDLL